MTSSTSDLAPSLALLSEHPCLGRVQRFEQHAGYDHGDYFYATFMADHLRFHAAQL
jgi:S-formylglutathione hydrolase FrmB